MSWFAFEARDAAGVLKKDRIEARDAAHAHRLIAEKGWFVLRVAEEGMAAATSPKMDASPSLGSPVAGFLARLRRASARRGLTPIKTEQLAQLLRAGMRLSEALGVMARRSADPAWQTVFEELRAGVVGGRALSDVMAAHPRLFSSMFRAMVAAGEISGHLVDVLERLAAYLQRREAVRQRVISALIYPCIIIVAGMMTIAFFMLVMLPRLSGMFKDMGQALPWSTQMLVWTSDALARFGWVIPIALVAAWFGFRSWLRSPEHRLSWDRSQLRWPLVGNLLALGEFSRLAQTLATLLQSGVTLVDALQVAEATLTNRALRGALRQSRVAVREGRSLHEALSAPKLFPDLMLDMLAVGERTGDLGGALQHTAQAYERDLDRAITTFTALIEPSLIVLMAAFVGSIVFSVLMAVFDLTSGIGRL
ncbi:MAG: type II secretion system F family protein [Verrucomicrobiia bacterium]